MEEVKPIGIDGDGFETLTQAVRDMLAEFGDMIGREIKFEELGEESGIAFSADNGALVITEREDVLGGITQDCQYPMFIVYRLNSTSEWQKLTVTEFLDNVGRWICGEKVVIKGKEYTLSHLPELTGERKIKRITRQNYYALEPNESGVQDWLLPVTVQYTNTIPPKW